jgi:hypothetical protein
MKTQVTIYLGLGLLGLIILALSLPQLHFQPGVPFSLGNPPPEISQENPASTGGDLSAIIRGIAAVMTLLLAVYIIIHLLTPEGRKRLLSDVLALGFLFLVLTLLPHNNQLPTAATQPAPAPQQQPQALPTTPIASIISNPPTWIDFVAIVILGILSAVLVVLIVGMPRRTKRRVTARERLAQHAESAVESLHQGGNLRNVVMQCYVDMENVVHEQRNIQRDQAMTVQEFESQLIEQGLPVEAVSRLTRLFEQVRYGTGVPGEAEEKEPMESLSAIVAACRNPGFDLFGKPVIESNSHLGSHPDGSQ